MKISLHFLPFSCFLILAKSKYSYDTAWIKHERSNFFQLPVIPHKIKDKKKWLFVAGQNIFY